MTIILMSIFISYVQLNITYCVGCDIISFPKRRTGASIKSSVHTDIQVDYNCFTPGDYNAEIYK
jgi:hypothetical protein